MIEFKDKPAGSNPASSTNSINKDVLGRLFYMPIQHLRTPYGVFFGVRFTH